jgi:hypothetical protein
MASPPTAAAPQQVRHREDAIQAFAAKIGLICSDLRVMT